MTVAVIVDSVAMEVEIMHVITKGVAVYLVLMHVVIMDVADYSWKVLS